MRCPSLLPGSHFLVHLKCGVKSARIVAGMHKLYGATPNVLPAWATIGNDVLKILLTEVGGIELRRDGGVEAFVIHDTVVGKENPRMS